MPGGGCSPKQLTRQVRPEFYRDGRQIRVSTRTEVKEKAKRELRRVMGDTERRLIPENELRRVRYADLREALLQITLNAGIVSADDDRRLGNDLGPETIR